MKRINRKIHVIFRGQKESLYGRRWWDPLGTCAASALGGDLPGQGPRGSIVPRMLGLPLDRLREIRGLYFPLAKVRHPDALSRKEAVRVYRRCWSEVLPLIGVVPRSGGILFRVTPLGRVFLSMLFAIQQRTLRVCDRCHRFFAVEWPRHRTRVCDRHDAEEPRRARYLDGPLAAAWQRAQDCMRKRCGGARDRQYIAWHRHWLPFILGIRDRGVTGEALQAAIARFWKESVPRAKTGRGRPPKYAATAS